jgi:predicted TIM-barrel fold metal-dependent hydrolase
MDIVDAQLHFGPADAKRGDSGFRASSNIIDSTLEGMNSLGIQSVLIDEYWYWEKSPGPTQNMPGFALPNGAWRNCYPLAELASILHPDRFSYFVRLDRLDPQLEYVMRVIASSPHARAFRCLPTRTAEEAAIFINGGYDQIFALAQDIGLPMCVFVPGYVEFLPRYLKAFPKLQFILDHWGVGIASNMTNRPEAEFRRSISLDYVDEIMKLAEHPNIVLKISHAPMYLQAPDYPFEGVRPHLRRAIEAFGANRILWATDKTVVHPPQSWADLLYYFRDDPEFSREEKQMILGANARRIFDWPAPAAA